MTRSIEVSTARSSRDNSMRLVRTWTAQTWLDEPARRELIRLNVLRARRANWLAIGVRT